MKMVVAALAAMLPGLALAQTVPVPAAVGPDNGDIGITRGEFEANGEVDRFSLTLQDAQDYSFGFEPLNRGFARWRVYGPTGALLCEAQHGEGYDDGCEIRAGRTGTFIVEGEKVELAGEDPPGPWPYEIRVSVDCRNGVKTRCRIRPGQDILRAFGWGNDGDWFRLERLVAGRTYTVTILPKDDDRSVNLQIRDGSGRAVGSATPSGKLTFKARTATAYVLAYVNDDLGPVDYHITLR